MAAISFSSARAWAMAALRGIGPRRGTQLARRFRANRGRAGAGVERMARARDGKPLLVQEPLDFEHHLHIAPAVKALASAAFVGLELGKLGFPEAKNVSFNAADAGDVANLEVEAVGDDRRLCRVFTGSL